eukprot:TRINITY_DN1466_c0_g1_i2.p1 TRINITY_DN1466_c0_g1~~TRINITY_DN1466_c0_g1_i2.p1  ORF type:complete len:195 (+),score=24.06 TRINITY_DN1466_c0_g1_i2:239-823(+)
MASTRCLLSSLLLVTLVSSACAASSGSLRGNPTVNSTLSPFEEAVQKLNASGFTKFASLAKVYGQVKEVKEALTEPLTLLVPDNKAFEAVKLTSYSAVQIARLAGFQAIRGVYTYSDLQMLKPNTALPTIAVDDAKKPLSLVKKSKANRKNQVVLMGRKNPRSTITIVRKNVFFKAGKLAVHTTNALAFPEGLA